MTINPKDARPDQPYEVTCGGERLVAQRIAPNDGGDPWYLIPPADSSLAERQVDRGIRDLVPLVPARNVTRDDLPRPESVEGWGYRATDPKYPSRLLDAVVAHLNERGGVPTDSDDKRERASFGQKSGHMTQRLRDLGFAPTGATWPGEDAPNSPLNSTHVGSSGKCCEEAALTANELARRNEALSEAEEAILATTNELVRIKKESQAEIAAQARNIKWWVQQYERAQDHRRIAEAERDELQAKLDAAEQRPTLDWNALREAVEDAWFEDDNDSYVSIDRLLELLGKFSPAAPEWLGDVPDRPEVKRTGDGRWSVEGRTYQHGFSPADMRRAGWDWFAIADHADVEEAATNDDEQVMATAKALYEVMSESSVPFEESNSTGKSKCISAARAGWTPPESEDEK